MMYIHACESCSTVLVPVGLRHSWFRPSECRRKGAGCLSIFGLSWHRSLVAVATAIWLCAIDGRRRDATISQCAAKLPEPRLNQFARCGRCSTPQHLSYHSRVRERCRNQRRRIVLPESRSTTKDMPTRFLGQAGAWFDRIEFRRVTWQIPPCRSDHVIAIR